MWKDAVSSGDLPTGARLNRECIGVLQCVSTDQVHIAAELHAAYLILRRGSAKVHAAVLFQLKQAGDSHEQEFDRGKERPQ